MFNSGPEHFTDSSALRIYVGFSDPIELADPRKIQYRFEFNFIRMLYSPLISFDYSGALTAGLAEEFYWNEGQAHFHLRTDAKTSRGDSITVDDVISTFERMGLTKGGTHGNLSDLMCGDIGTPAQCLNIVKVSSRHFYIQFPKRSEFLFKILSSMDYAIVPKSALNKVRGEIEDWTNTTGPYWLDGKMTANKSLLRAHKSHWQWSEGMPDAIELIYNNPNKSGLVPLEQFFEDLLSGHISLIPTYAFVPHHKLAEFINAHEDLLNIHHTEHISIEHLRTTRSSKDFSEEHLRFILRLVKSEYSKSMISTNIQNSAGIEFVVAMDQFFHPKSFGGLDPSEIVSLSKLECEEPKLNSSRKFKLGCSLNLKSRYESRLGKALKFVEVIELDSQKSRESVDAYFAEIDCIFEEDVAQLYFIANTGLLPLSDDERALLLKRYVNEVNIDTRLRMLRDIHLEMLQKMTVVPLVAKPYFAVANKKWKMNLPTCQAGTPIWGITRTS